VKYSEHPAVNYVTAFIYYIYLLRHEGSTGKHKHTNIQNIQKKLLDSESGVLALKLLHHCKQRTAWHRPGL